MSNARKRIILSTALIFALAAPFSASAQMDLSREMANPGFNPERTSIVVADVSTGKIIASHRPDLALNPASCSKIVTSITALELLGPDYRFRTIFAADAPAQAGAIGTLYVRGEGDPSLINEEIAKIAINLRENGLRRITGGIVIDNSYFNSFDFPRKGGDDGRAFTAKISAVAVNFNSIGVTVAPGRSGGSASVKLEPPLEDYRVINKVITSGKTRIYIKTSTGGEGMSVTVSGSISPRAGPSTYWRSVEDPVGYAGAVIAHHFREAGIEVTGPIRSGGMPASASIVAEQLSRPLAEIVYDMNKLSTNFVAEQITKHLGAKRMGAPGSTEKGVAAMEEHLATLGVPRGSAMFENGSGLSAVSRISAQQLVQVLVSAYQNRKLRGDFINSLSVLGVDGTMKNWGRIAPDLVGSVYAKTGTLDGVSTLAGYVPMSDNRLAAFAILANGLPKGAWAAKEAELAVLKTIAGISK
ncbi:MAG: D-alanyl-D-alanine carboxypeptidase/D-alanyl-D-alanine-endopeptidase [bacterium]